MMPGSLVVSKWSDLSAYDPDTGLYHGTIERPGLMICLHFYDAKDVWQRVLLMSSDGTIISTYLNSVKDVLR